MVDKSDKDGDRREDTGPFPARIYPRKSYVSKYWKLSPVPFEMQRACLKCITMKSALAQEMEDKVIFKK